jgi:hypothetical protein
MMPGLPEIGGISIIKVILHYPGHWPGFPVKINKKE